MHRIRYSLIAALAACAGLGFWGARSHPTAANAQSAPTAGQLELMGKNGKSAGLCPLKHTSVNVDIAGYVSRVTVTQQFTNPSTTPVEAVYTFPLPSDAAVDDMTMTIGSRVIKGEILKKEEARQVYEAARNRGQAAALLDQERPNIFTQSVANIMPGEGVNITISYVNLLKYQDGVYEFVFPMVVGPRYVPGGGYTEPGKRGEASPTSSEAEQRDTVTKAIVTDADKITPPIAGKGTRAGHDISVTVNLDCGLPLGEVGSTLHQVTTQRIGRSRAVIKLKDQETIPNRDFILKYTAAGSEMQSGVLTYSDGKGGGYFTLIVQPPAAPAQTDIAPKEMVFVIDQTGSQSGWPIKKAKETMRYAISNMRQNDTFQLIGFNTELFPCFDAPVHKTPENVAKALKFLEPIEGNGGTDILKSVDYALKIPDDPNRLRIVCYLTDGYVGNDMQIIDSIRKNRGRARMFPFGMGNSVNRFLIDGMAREGRGCAEYVTIESNTGAVMGTSRELSARAQADAAEAVKRFYHRIDSPVLLDPQVEWNGLPVDDIYPKAIPDVFSAGPVILKGRYTKAGEGDITIKGILRGEPWQQTLHVTLPPVNRNGSAIATLWAREKIEDLQSQGWMGAQTGKTDPQLQNHITNVALEYRLMSQYTSFVAVEHRVVNVGGKQRTIDVPVEMPDAVSHDGIFGRPEAKKSLVQLQRSQGRGFGANAAGASLQFQRANNLSSLSAARGGLAPAAPSPPVQFGLAAPKSEGLQKTGRATVPQILGKENKVKAPALHASLGDEIAAVTEARANDKIDRYALFDGEKGAYKALDDLKPQDRRSLLREVKLDARLQNLVSGHGKGKVDVQIWLNSVPAGAMAKLKELGFTYSTTLIPGKLVLGSVTADRLDALIALQFVRRIEIPKLK